MIVIGSLELGQDPPISPGPSDPTQNGRRQSQPVPTNPTPFQRPRVVRKQPDYPWIAVEGSELDLDRPISLGTV
ncbi:hypothetical protein PGT21_027305 [Puccinia graminis f. sp. tritici]|uniref:Uncharacterized protein n=1 Tax=Puccinia graminis f. sp. tritici TaxID=56615 RepID=A0A5B0QJL0_PUCGR|nr:hypothetical protein PGT21_027305 [Puccinia graminis f. sp. tritici]